MAKTKPKKKTKHLREPSKPPFVRPLPVNGPVDQQRVLRIVREITIYLGQGDSITRARHKAGLTSYTTDLAFAVAQNEDFIAAANFYKAKQRRFGSYAK